MKMWIFFSRCGNYGNDNNDFETPFRRKKLD